MLLLNYLSGSSFIYPIYYISNRSKNVVDMVPLFDDIQSKICELQSSCDSEILLITLAVIRKQVEGLLAK